MPDTRNPLVTVLIPTYNRAALLARAMMSVLSQKFADFEVVVLNDASTDGTKKYLDDLAAKDVRIKPLHRAKNSYPDISASLNEGLSLARGKYIARLDDDDYWCDPEKLGAQVDFFESHPDHVVAGGGTIVVDENDRERFRYRKLETDEAIRDKALFANPFTHSTVMFRRDVARAAGGYGDFKNAEDWDLWLRMGLQGKFYNSQDYFVRYLLNEKSKTFIFKRSQSKEILRLIAAHKKEYPHFAAAYSLNFLQYCYSLLPSALRSGLYNFLSRAKRSVFSSRKKN